MVIKISYFFFLMIRRPQRSTLFPHPTLFRSTTRPPQRDFVEHKGSRTEINLNRVLLATNFRPSAEAAEHIAFELARSRSEEHTSELQSRQYLVCRLLLEKKK